jgi:hypothetical protein
LLVEAELHGERVRFTGRARGPRTQAEWGRVFRISGAYGTPPDTAALREHTLTSAERAGVLLAPGVTVRVLRADYATAPEQWDRPPQNPVLLSTFRVDP